MYLQCSNNAFAHHQDAISILLTYQKKSVANLVNECGAGVRKTTNKESFFGINSDENIMIEDLRHVEVI
jgi:hypothetical protein